ncbi:4-hydroxy-2-oxoheptanedioate aldolase [Actinoplanes lutulentus]|uniref:4-hydroxy-2-oxoheptanedioate aldolase n=2 Tax=Actinoplanes lutulentus TaxID=1287878 RepID=A0A327ZA23_9ACTN|nr:4-hydroxy-2-oxoheptanedioate aldolase [Actinoplanes lutulentus]
MAEGRPSVGLWAAGPSAASAEILGRSGLDWILVDMQHGSANAADLLPLIQAIELGGSHALVRVPANDASLIMRALDLGAIGVIVPMVSTAAQARAAAEATRYPPAGNRSFGPIRNFYGLDRAEASTTCLVMIETAEGLANVDEIAATPGVDGLFVGPVDLGLALGAGLRLTAGGVVDEAISQVVEAATRHGIIAGVAGLSPEHAESLLSAGARLVTVGSDLGYVTKGLAGDRERAEQWAARFARPGTTTSG